MEDQRKQYTETAAQAIAPAATNSDLMSRTPAAKTPSWISIVEAYHREGNGDREMLLALLNAKAKEDER